MAGNQESSLLEHLYDKEVQLDDVKDKKSQAVLKKVLKTVLDTAKEKSPAFKELYREIHYGGSYWDKLKVKSTDFEFDLNIVFQTPKSNWFITNLNDDVRKPNFANIQTSRHPSSEAWNSLLTKDRQANLVISPKKMYSLLQTAVDRAITEIGNVVLVNNENFRVTRSTGAPVILNVEGPQVKFTVDLVPSFKLELYHLKTACSDLKTRVDGMLKDFNIDVKDFMAIALKNASSDMFEVDFHDIERGLLEKSGGCVYKVIKLIKYLRDKKGGTIYILWSHLLKTSVMHHVLRQERAYWNSNNLQTCFVDCIRNLWMGLHKELITDIFFPDFNMLERIGEGQVLKQACTWLDSLVKKYNRTEDISVFFPELAIGGTLSVDHLGSRVQEIKITSGGKDLMAIGCGNNQFKKQEFLEKDKNPDKQQHAQMNPGRFECEICEKSFTGIESQEEHFKSKKHIIKYNEKTETCSKAKLNVGKSIQMLPTNPVDDRKYECKICEKSFTGIESQEEHLKSRKHLNKDAEKNNERIEKDKEPSINMSKLINERCNQTVQINSVVANKFECELCEKSFTGIESQAEHFKSRKHLNKDAEKTQKIVSTIKEKDQQEKCHGSTMPVDNQKNALNDTNFECKICEKSFTGIESKEEHFKSKRHLNKCIEEQVKFPIVKNINNFECIICQKIFSGIESQNEHLKSKKHLAKMSLN